MKLFEVADEPMVILMLRKLQAKGHPVAVNAHGNTNYTGNDTVGWTPFRSHMTGWVMKLDDRHVKNHLNISGDETYDNNQTKIPNFRRSFHMQEPVDENYTLKKIDGVWTLIDSTHTTVNESSELPFIWTMAKKLKKMGKRVSFGARLNPRQENSVYLEGEVMGISDSNVDIWAYRRNWQYAIEKDDDEWFVLNRVPTESSEYYVVGELTSVKEDKGDEEFVLSLMQKKLTRAGVESRIEFTDRGTPYLTAPYAGFSVNIYFDESDKEWLVAWFYNGVRQGELKRFNNMDDVVSEIV